MSYLRAHWPDVVRSGVFVVGAVVSAALGATPLAYMFGGAAVAEVSAARRRRPELEGE